MAGPTATQAQVERLLADMAKSANTKAEEIRRRHAAAAAQEIDGYFKQVLVQMKSTANRYGYESFATLGSYGSVGQGYNAIILTGKPSPFGPQRPKPIR